MCDPGKFQYDKQDEFWRSIIKKYESRNYQLQREHQSLLQKVDAMDASMPAVMAYNMTKLVKEQPEADIDNLVKFPCSCNNDEKRSEKIYKLPDLTNTSVFSIEDADIFYMERIKYLTEQEKKLIEEVNKLRSREIALKEARKKVDQISEEPPVQKILGGRNLRDMNERLLVENRRLYEELSELKLEIKKMNENEINEDIERERKKSIILEAEINSIKSDKQSKMDAVNHDINLLKKQLEACEKNLENVADINNKLKQEINLSCGKIQLLQKDICNQKISEANTAAALKAQIDYNKAHSKPPPPPPTPPPSPRSSFKKFGRKKGDDDDDDDKHDKGSGPGQFYNIARDLSQDLLDAKENENFPKSVMDAIDEVRCLCDLMDKTIAKQQNDDEETCSCELFDQKIIPEKDISALTCKEGIEKDLECKVVLECQDEPECMEFPCKDEIARMGVIKEKPLEEERERKLASCGCEDEETETAEEEEEELASCICDEELSEEETLAEIEAVEEELEETIDEVIEEVMEEESIIEDEIIEAAEETLIEDLIEEEIKKSIAEEVIEEIVVEAAVEEAVEEAVIEEAVEEAVIEEAVEEAVIEEAVEEAVEEAPPQKSEVCICQDLPEPICIPLSSELEEKFQAMIDLDNAEPTEPVFVTKISDGEVETTTISREGTIEITTVGPEGTIETTLSVTASGNIEVLTEYSEIEAAPPVEEEIPSIEYEADIEVSALEIVPSLSTGLTKAESKELGSLSLSIIPEPVVEEVTPTPPSIPTPSISLIEESPSKKVICECTEDGDICYKMKDDYEVIGVEISVSKEEPDEMEITPEEDLGIVVEIELPEGLEIDEEQGKVLMEMVEEIVDEFKSVIEEEAEEPGVESIAMEEIVEQVVETISQKEEELIEEFAEEVTEITAEESVEEIVEELIQDAEIEEVVEEIIEESVEEVVSELSEIVGEMIEKATCLCLQKRAAVIQETLQKIIDESICICEEGRSEECECLEGHKEEEEISEIHSAEIEEIFETEEPEDILEAVSEEIIEEVLLDDIEEKEPEVQSGQETPIKEVCICLEPEEEVLEEEIIEVEVIEEPIEEEIVPDVGEILEETVEEITCICLEPAEEVIEEAVEEAVCICLEPSEEILEPSVEEITTPSLEPTEEILEPSVGEITIPSLEAKEEVVEETVEEKTCICLEATEEIIDEIFEVEETITPIEEVVLEEGIKEEVAIEQEEEEEEEEGVVISITCSYLEEPAEKEPSESEEEEEEDLLEEETREEIMIESPPPEDEFDEGGGDGEHIAILVEEEEEESVEVSVEEIAEEPEVETEIEKESLEEISEASSIHEIVSPVAVGGEEEESLVEEEEAVCEGPCAEEEEVFLEVPYEEEEIVEPYEEEERVSIIHEEELLEEVRQEVQEALSFVESALEEVLSAGEPMKEEEEEEEEVREVSRIPTFEAIEEMELEEEIEEPIKIASLGAIEEAIMPEEEFEEPPPIVEEAVEPVVEKVQEEEISEEEIEEVAKDQSIEELLEGEEIVRQEFEIEEGELLVEEAEEKFEEALEEILVEEIPAEEPSISIEAEVKESEVISTEESTAPKVEYDEEEESEFEDVQEIPAETPPPPPPPEEYIVAAPLVEIEETLEAVVREEETVEEFEEVSEAPFEEAFSEVSELPEISEMEPETETLEEGPSMAEEAPAELSEVEMKESTAEEEDVSEVVVEIEEIKESQSVFTSSLSSPEKSRSSKGSRISKTTSEIISSHKGSQNLRSLPSIDESDKSSKGVPPAEEPKQTCECPSLDEDKLPPCDCHTRHPYGCLCIDCLTSSRSSDLVCGCEIPCPCDDCDFIERGIQPPCVAVCTGICNVNKTNSVCSCEEESDESDSKCSCTFEICDYACPDRPCKERRERAKKVGSSCSCTFEICDDICPDRPCRKVKLEETKTKVIELRTTRSDKSASSHETSKRRIEIIKEMTPRCSCTSLFSTDFEDGDVKVEKRRSSNISICPEVCFSKRSSKSKSSFSNSRGDECSCDQSICDDICEERPCADKYRRRKIQDIHPSDISVSGDRSHRETDFDEEFCPCDYSICDETCDDRPCIERKKKKKTSKSTKVKLVEETNKRKRKRKGSKEEYTKTVEELQTLVHKIKCSCSEAENISSKVFTKKASDYNITMSGLKVAIDMYQKKAETKDVLIEAMKEELKTKTDARNLESLFDSLIEEKEEEVGQDYGRSILAEELPHPTHKIEKFGKPPPECPCEDVAGPSSFPIQPCECAVDPTPLEIINIRRIGPTSLLIKWVPPISRDIVGYEICINGVIKSKVFSPFRTSAIIDDVEMKLTLNISLYAVAYMGRCHPPALAVYKL